jgi:hypothetical protein
MSGKLLPTSKAGRKSAYRKGGVTPRGTVESDELRGAGWNAQSERAPAIQSGKSLYSPFETFRLFTCCFAFCTRIILELVGPHRTSISSVGSNVRYSNKIFKRRGLVAVSFTAVAATGLRLAAFRLRCSFALKCCRYRNAVCLACDDRRMAPAKSRA